MSEVMEADRRRYERDIERAFFTAWCTEMFARQKTLDQWAVALKKFRDARVGAGKPQPISDWHLEREQLKAIRDRYEAAADPDKKRKQTK